MKRTILFIFLSACAFISVAQSNKFAVPTMFSPNNDGKNDTFVVYGENIQGFRFVIYNRLGDKIYESTVFQEVASKGWNGQKDGISQPSEMYVWVVYGTFKDGNTIRDTENMQTGKVLLIR